MTPNFYLLLNGFLILILFLQNIIFVFFLNRNDFIGNLFNLDLEFNIPSLYSSYLFLYSCYLLFKISRKKSMKGDKNILRIFSLIFFVFSIDEFFMLHERLPSFLYDQELKIIFLFPFLKYWFFSYTIFFILISILFIPFLKKQTKNIKFIILLSGVIYFSGAVGMEVINYLFIKFTNIDRQDILFKSLFTIEEILEMIGLNLFNIALLKKIKSLKNI